MIQPNHNQTRETKPFDNELYRQQASIANLWVILATIVVSAMCSLPFAGPERQEMAMALRFILSQTVLPYGFPTEARIGLRCWVTQRKCISVQVLQWCS